MALIKVKESDILKAILDYLKMRGHLCRRSNTGKMFGEHKGKKWAIHMGEKGWPDIDVVLPDGRYCGIEVKSEIGTLKDEQIDIGKKILNKNALWFVARNLDDVMAQGL